jgi:hypothetical protein
MHKLLRDEIIWSEIENNLTRLLIVTSKPSSVIWNTFSLNPIKKITGDW